MHIQNPLPKPMKYGIVVLLNIGIVFQPDDTSLAGFA